MSESQESNCSTVKFTPGPEIVGKMRANQVKEMELVLPLELPNGKQTKTTAFPIKISDYKFNIYRPPPNLGNDNNEIISDWLKKD